jgi:hypothetical protein
MAIKLVVAVTDSDWFTLLRRQPLLKDALSWHNERVYKG